MDLNVSQLKHDLKEIYSAYLINSDDENIKNKAGQIYNNYKDLDPILKPEIAIAINKLVDVAFDTGLKISKDEIKTIIDKLEKCKL